MYREQLEIEALAEQVRPGGYGIEWWFRGWGMPPLTDEHIERLAAASEGMRVSFHSVRPSLIPMKTQIDAVARIGAEMQVTHPAGLMTEGPEDWDGARALVDYAEQKGVKLALENGLDDQDILIRLLEDNESLGFCYDVGHGYRCKPVLDHKYFLAGVFGERLCHLHLQDILPLDERDLPGGVGVDHFMIGTGSIPHDFWVALGEFIKEHDYRGLMVFELRPRNVIHLVTRSRAFVEGMWDGRG